MAAPYPPIADYALLSDCHSSALVSTTGSVDWACLRRFDANSVFCRLLDWERGGHFAITARAVRSTSRRYIGDSLVLETTVVTDTGTARIIDAFAMQEGGSRNPYNQLLRIVKGDEGFVELDVVIEPRFDYGELHPWLRHHNVHQVYSAVGGDTAVVLSAEWPMAIDEARCQITGVVRVAAGERAAFGLHSQLPHDLHFGGCTGDELEARLEATVRWWHRWSGRTVAEGPYAEYVRRSATVLKGLTCAPTGAIIAAPTTSLPETMGGGRNWDYRYTWIRDSTLVLAALELTNHPEVARGFRDFILRTAAGDAADLQIMYGVDGRRYLPEHRLEQLDGYRGSRPVRIGNDAYTQTQHDMYGQVLDAADLWQRGHEKISEHEWRFLRGLVNRAIDVWQQPDRGIWEVRGQPRHFVHSKVWLWVAVDRGIDLVREEGLDCPDLDRWLEARAAIRAAVDTQGVSPTGGYFTQTFEQDQLDASLLELPLVGFVAATDERMVATVDAIQEQLAMQPHGFLRRYLPTQTDDGLAQDEGTFLLCSFWLVDVLAMQGRVAEATALFERLLDVSNDLGLFAEEYDVPNERLLGNFPQAFTHMALINSAHQLRVAADPSVAPRDKPWPTRDRMKSSFGSY